MSNTDHTSAARSYYPPPDDYPAPTAACCDRQPIFVPVVGGHKWVHLTANPDPLGRPWFDATTCEWRQSGSKEHEVVLAARWFDVATGEWREPDDVFIAAASEEMA